MQTTAIKQGQSFFDKAIETTGSAESAFEMSVINNVSITAELPIGFEVIPAKVLNPSVVKQFNNKNTPATALKSDDYLLLNPTEGIGAMIIEDTFIVF